MKRLLTIALAAISITSAIPAAQAAPQLTGSSYRWDWCRFQSLQDGRWTVKEVHLTIHCALAHWPSDHAKVDAIAYRESKYFWHATNPISGACGIFQSMPRLWPGRIRTFNDTHPNWNAGPSCYNARSNILWSVNTMHASGFSPWGG